MMTSCIAGLQAYAQTDTEFWFVAPEISIYAPYNLDRPIILHITTYGQPATVTISQPAGGGMPLQTLSIPAGSTQNIDLTTWIDFIENKPPNTVLNYGLHIEATAPVTVYYEANAGRQNEEAFVLKGKNALGTDFWIPGQNYFDNSPTFGYVPQPYPAFDIVATQNNTTVTITPSASIVGHAAGVPFSVTLHAGQTYSATSVSATVSGQLLGSRVTADKPVAITATDDLLSNLIYGGCADLGGDQIVPVPLLGTEYIAMRGLLTAPGDQVFVTATQNGTAISRDGAPATTINAGQTYRVTLAAPVISTYIQASHPVYVWQVSGTGCEIGAALLPRITCTGSSLVSYVRTTNVDLYLNVLVRNGGQGNFLVNGSAGVITAGQFTAVPGTGGQWLTAQVSLPLAQYPQGSVVKVSNTAAQFHLGVLEGHGDGTSYGYFSNFGSVTAVAHAGAASLCAGEDILLYADTAGATAVYDWRGPNGFSSGQQNPVIPQAGAAAAGHYVLTVDIPGCPGDSDTVTVAVTPAPVVDLGPDTALCADSVTLSSSGSYTSPGYLWSSGQTTPALTVKQPGTYRLQVTDQGCTGSDTINVSLSAALAVHLGNDTGICDRDIPLILSSPQPPGTQYLWSTGLTTPSIGVTRTDTYWLSAILGDCSGSDTITVKVIPTPSVHIGNDSFICAGQPANIGDVIPGATYLWNTGSTSSSIEISESGSYWLTADLEGCRVSDTVQITVTPLPEPDLGTDRDICPEQVIVLDASYAGGSYQWSTGDTTSSLSVRSAGTYSVRVHSAYGCAGGDTVIFSWYPLPVVSLGADTTVCEETPLVLKPFYTNSDSLRWSDGSVGAMLTVSSGGRYIVSGINKCGEARDTISVKQIFCDICVPNAFTPNGDGVNDVFRVLGNTGRLESFRLRVFNRWGQLLFETSDKGKGWDGRQSGGEAPLGAYAYMLEYSLNNKPVTQKGNFTLLR